MIAWVALEDRSDLRDNLFVRECSFPSPQRSFSTLDPLDDSHPTRYTLAKKTSLFPFFFEPRFNPAFRHIKLLKRHTNVMVKLSIIAPLVYIAVLVGTLAVFSSLYRKRKASKCYDP